MLTQNLHSRCNAWLRPHMQVFIMIAGHAFKLYVGNVDAGTRILI